jgi:GT2 family glycosyltransferase
MISVIIPVYKNKEQLIENLKHNLRFLRECEVIVVNDDPETDLKEDLKTLNQVVLIENEANIGFGESVNKGVGKASYKYVMLLNSDVRLRDNSFITVIDDFKSDDSLFAVSFAQQDKNEVVGKNSIYWEKGFFKHRPAPDLKQGPNAWAEGGSSVIDKEKFMKLGGFDPLFSPFYWEDIDLSYRALKVKYKIIFSPKVMVDHRHESTIGKYYSQEAVKTVAFRNQLVFIWKNITDLSLVLNHILFLIPTLMLFLIKGEFSFVKGFFIAVSKIPAIIKTKTVQKKSFIQNDRYLLGLFSSVK